MPAIPIIALGLSALGTGYSVYSGQQQAVKQKENLDLQQKAQQQAETSAVNQDRLAQENQKRARKKSPDLNVLLGDLMKPKPGPAGVNADQLLLGRPSLLGG
jgi:uncharacterized protein HemX